MNINCITMRISKHDSVFEWNNLSMIITLFISMIMSCGTDNIWWNIFHVQTENEEHYAKYRQSHITMLWICVMLSLLLSIFSFSLEGGVRMWPMNRENQPLVTNWCSIVHIQPQTQVFLPCIVCIVITTTTTIISTTVIYITTPVTREKDNKKGQRLFTSLQSTLVFYYVTCKLAD